MSEMSGDQKVAALKHELAGYIAAGQSERAAQVRAEIARVLGGDVLEVKVAEPVEAAAPRRKKA